MQVRNWIFVEDFCAAIDLVLERGEAGEAYNVGGPDELPNIEVVKTILELTGRDESLIEYVTDRLGHDRRYSLSLREGPRARLGGRRWASTRACGGPWSGIATTSGGGGRSARGEYREYYERQYGRALGADGAAAGDASSTGVVLIEPEVHGDERGFLVETFRDDAWRELGVEVDFVQDNHSRSARNILRGLHFQTSPGQAKLVRCLRGRIWDVAVDLRRDSPTYRQWEGHELDDERHRQLFVPVGFAHGFCVLSERGRRRLQAVELLRPGHRGRDRLGRPRRRRRVADHGAGALRARPQRASPGRDRRRASLCSRTQLRARRPVSRPAGP